MSGSFNKSNLDDIIGLPPSAYYAHGDIDVTNFILNSMPIMEIYPGLPKYGEGEALFSDSQGKTSKGKGMQLYSFDEASGQDQYFKILQNAGVTYYNDLPLRVAFQGTDTITESWSAEYNESKFEELGNAGVPFIREARYLTGQRDMAKAAERLVKQFEKSPVLQGFARTLQGGIAVSENTVKEIAPDRYEQQMMKLFAGSNLDFPKIWAGASFSPSYSATIKLFNPYPNDDESFIKYMVDPIIKILALIVPVSDSESTFSFPLICKVNCPGMFEIKMGYIGNIDLTKGGTNNDFAFDQQFHSAEIRITFHEMYSTMISLNEEYRTTSDANRPTLKAYRDNIVTRAKLAQPIHGNGIVSSTYSLDRKEDFPTANDSYSSNDVGAFNVNDTIPARIPADLKSIAELDVFRNQSFT